MGGSLMESAEFLPGNFSKTGRVTGRQITRLRNYCDLEDPFSPKAGGATSSTASASQEKPPLDGDRTKAAGLGMQRSQKLPVDLAALPLSRASTDAPNSPAGTPSSTWPRGEFQASRASALSRSAGSLGAARSSTGGLAATSASIASAATIRSLPLPQSQNPLGGEDEEPDSGTVQLTRKQRIALGDEPPTTRPAPTRPSPVFVGPERDKAPPGHLALTGGSGTDGPTFATYKPSHEPVRPRPPCCDFRERPRHVSRKAEEPDITVRDPFGHQDLTSPALSLAARALEASASGVEPMQRQTARRDLERCQGRNWRESLNMHEASPYAKAWALHDLPSSRRSRAPQWDFEKMSGRGPVVRPAVSEPGMYSVSYSAVEPSVKTVLPFEKGLTRSQAEVGQLGHNVPKGAQRATDPRVRPDRSLHRGCALTRPRVKHVSDFDAELPRPPLSKAEKAYYDEEDPEASSEWLQRRLEYDPSSADHAIIPRHDHAPDLAQMVGRDDARGGRLLETDQGVLLLRRCSGPAAHPEPSASVDFSKESPTRPRPDLCVKKFEQYASRQPSRLAGTHSPLHRPRSTAGGDFHRSARRGYNAKAVLPRRPASQAGRQPAWVEDLPPASAAEAAPAEAQAPGAGLEGCESRAEASAR